LQNNDGTTLKSVGILTSACFGFYTGIEHMKKMSTAQSARVDETALEQAVSSSLLC